MNLEDIIEYVQNGRLDQANILLLTEITLNLIAQTKAANRQAEANRKLAEATNRQAAALELIAATLCGNGAMTEQVERIGAALDKIAGKTGVIFTKSAGAE